MIRLYNYHLDDFVEIAFRQNGKLWPQGLKQVNQLFRSRDNDEINPINPKLLDLLDHLQDHFGVDTVEIISGYRRKEFNKSLLASGRQVSPRSLHIRGQAVDFHMDEIREETLRDYLQSLQLGGVGYYGPLDFVHIDTGSFRTWGGSDKFARKLIGILDDDAPVQLNSDKNDYLPQDSLYFTWNFSKGYKPKKVQAVRLERFWRGKWVTCPSQALPQKESMLPIADLNCPLPSVSIPYGKYRWVFKVAGYDGLLSSNEFYLKKQ